MNQNNYKRIAETGDVVKVVMKNGTTFTGFVSHLFSILKIDGVIDTEILLSQHRAHDGEDFGDVCLPVSGIEGIQSLPDFNSASRKNQCEFALNVSNIQRIMDGKEISKEELLRKAKLSEADLSKVLNSNAEELSLKDAMAIAKAIDISLDEIIS